MVNYTKKRLVELGIEPERVEMFNMSASMAFDFVESVKIMDKRARDLGPSPLSPNFDKFSKSHN